jgi:hypothetical protein
MSKVNRKLAIIVAVVLSVWIVTVAYATIPDSQGVIHGCRKLNNPAKGSVIVVDSEAGESCPSGFAELNWNQTGFTGYRLVSRSAEGTYPPNSDGGLIVQCSSGERPLGGGGGILRADGSQAQGLKSEFALTHSSNPVDWDGDGVFEGWHIQVRYIGDTTEILTLRVWVICADVQ